MVWKKIIPNTHKHTRTYALKQNLLGRNTHTYILCRVGTEHSCGSEKSTTYPVTLTMICVDYDTQGMSYYV